MGVFVGVDMFHFLKSMYMYVFFRVCESMCFFACVKNQRKSFPAVHISEITKSHLFHIYNLVDTNQYEEMREKYFKDKVKGKRPQTCSL